MGKGTSLAAHLAANKTGTRDLGCSEVNGNMRNFFLVEEYAQFGVPHDGLSEPSQDDAE